MRISDWSSDVCSSDLFGITQPTEVDFDLDNATPADGAVRKKCSAVIRSIEDALGATPYTGVQAFCSSQFFDDLVDHKDCRSEERRVGTEGVSTGRSRGSPLQ